MRWRWYLKLSMKRTVFFSSGTVVPPLWCQVQGQPLELPSKPQARPTYGDEGDEATSSDVGLQPFGHRALRLVETSGRGRLGEEQVWVRRFQPLAHLFICRLRHTSASP